MKERLIETLKSDYGFYKLNNSELPETVLRKIDNYFNYITDCEGDFDDFDIFYENFEDCNPDVEYILKDYVLNY